MYLFQGDKAKIQQVNDMEQVLSNLYNSIKWIENASVDLTYQVDDIQNKIDTHANKHIR